MNQTLKLWIDAYFYGCMFAGMLLWLFTIGVAQQNDWIVLLDFNRYGEGVIEYAMMLVWLLVATYKGFEILSGEMKR